MSLTYQDELTIEKIVDKKIQPLEKKIDKVITLLDAFAGNVEKLQQEHTMVEGHKDQLEDHEERITSLESAVSTNA